MSGQRGSASIVLVVALMFAMLLALFAADLSRVATARGRAQAAADAAALAAAQELVSPSGRTPDTVAREYAERHGASVVSCDCALGGDEVVVGVRLAVTLPFLRQERAIEAFARAVVAGPPGSERLQPFFVARLVCLFDRVPGVWIVSGYRTRAEQAALYEQKPGLAAPPGHSNHELGLAADLGYPSADAEREAHLAAAGCGLEFPMSYEPWHVEPAGI